MPPPRQVLDRLIQCALAEDQALHDVTSQAVIPSGTSIKADIVVKAKGVLAGGRVALRVFQRVDPSLRVSLKKKDGMPVKSGETILTVKGKARSIFAAERTALNFLGHLSGIATLTRAFVSRTGSLRTEILDTRKTLPGLRALEKDAVHAGGGTSHRMDLADQILIKTNHIRAISIKHTAHPGPTFAIAGAGSRQHTADSTSIQKLIVKARRARPKRFVAIEATNMQEFLSAIKEKPDCILLDNWQIANIRKAVKQRNALGKKILLEVSGGVTLANVRAIARTGVERISIGRLTHSATSLDVSLRVLGR